MERRTTPRHYRETAGLSVAAAARRADTDRSTIERIEAGRDVRTDSLHRVAEALGVDLATYALAYLYVRGSGA